MLSLKIEAAILLVSQYHDIAIADGARYIFHVLLSKPTARGILGRVKDDQFGVWSLISPANSFTLKRELHLFA